MNKKLTPLVREIGWTKNVQVLRIQDQIYKNPSIGMILCRERNRTVVSYALKKSNKHIGVAVYRIARRLLVELKSELPVNKQIERFLSAVEFYKDKDGSESGECA